MIKWSLEELDLGGDFCRGGEALGRSFRVYVDEVKDAAHAQAEFFTTNSSAEVQREFQEFLGLEHDDNSLEGFLLTLDQLNLSLALRAGLEMGFVHFWALLFMIQVPEILNIPGVSMVQTSYPLPLINPNLVGDYIRENNLARFKALSVHLDPSVSAVAYVQAIQDAYAGKLYLHAHQLWSEAEQVKSFLDEIKTTQVSFLAQPLAGHNLAQMRLLLEDRRVAWFLEEGLGNQEVGPGMAAVYQGVSLSLMRAGGYFGLLRQIKSAQRLGIKVSLDSGISTSLLAAAAMHLAHEVDYCEFGGFLWPHKESERCLDEDNGQVMFHYLQ